MEFHIDGMDCTGKSATIHEIGLVSDVDRRHRLLIPDNPYMAEFRRRQAQFAWNSGEVTEGLLDAIDYDIANYQHGGVDLIQESTLIAKGFAMRVAAGAPRSVLSQFEDRLAAHPRFDGSVYMTVNDDERLARFQSRLRSGGAISDNDRMIIDDFERFKRIETIMLDIARTAFGATVLDVSCMTPYEAAVAVSPFRQRAEVAA